MGEGSAVAADATEICWWVRGARVAVVVLPKADKEPDLCVKKEIDDKRDSTVLAERPVYKGPIAPRQSRVSKQEGDKCKRGASRPRRSKFRGISGYKHRKKFLTALSTMESIP